MEISRTIKLTRLYEAICAVGRTRKKPLNVRYIVILRFAAAFLSETIRQIGPETVSLGVLTPIESVHRHSGESRNPFLRLLPFIKVPAHRRGMKRRRSFTRIRKWIPAFAGMTSKGEKGRRSCRDRPPCLSMRSATTGRDIFETGGHAGPPLRRPHDCCSDSPSSGLSHRSRPRTDTGACPLRDDGDQRVRTGTEACPYGPSPVDPIRRITESGLIQPPSGGCRNSPRTGPERPRRRPRP